MRLRCCLCIPPIVARQRLGKNPSIVARQRLSKNSPIVDRQQLAKNPLIVAGQRLGKKIHLLLLVGNEDTRNTRRIVGRVVFSARVVSRKVGD
jgi:hypothetical protein